MLDQIWAPKAPGHLENTPLPSFVYDIITNNVVYTYKTSIS